MAIAQTITSFSLRKFVYRLDWDVYNPNSFHIMLKVAVEAAFLVMDKFTKVEEIVAKAISNVKEEKSESP